MTGDTGQNVKRLGRPRKDGRPPVTKAEIMSVSARLFALEGFAGTSMRLICKELGVTTSSVFHQFPSKQAILEKIFATAVLPELAFYKKISKVDAPAAAKLYKIITSDIREVAQINPQLKGVLGLPEVRNPRFKELYKLRKKTINHFRKLVGAGIQEGDFRPLDTKIISEVVTLLGEFPVYTSTSLGSPGTQSAEIAQFVFLGLLKHPSRLKYVQQMAAKIPEQFVRPEELT